MLVKKFNGKVVGAELSSNEKKAVDIEIRKMIADYDRKNTNEIDSLVLWILHTEFGFGVKRLQKFHDSFNDGIKRLLERYELEDDDQIWLCTHKLKQLGIDIEKMNGE